MYTYLRKERAVLRPRSTPSNKKKSSYHCSFFFFSFFFLLLTLNNPYIKQGMTKSAMIRKRRIQKKKMLHPSFNYPERRTIKKKKKVRLMNIALYNES